jgi:hypothetical protein
VAPANDERCTVSPGPTRQVETTQPTADSLRPANPGEVVNNPDARRGASSAGNWPGQQRACSPAPTHAGGLAIDKVRFRRKIYVTKWEVSMQLRHAAIYAAVLCSFAAAAFAQEPAMIYGDTLDERALALAVGPDSGYCLAGWTRSYGDHAPAFTNILVVKTDPLGIPQWSLVSGGQEDEEANSIVTTGDGGYAFCGWTGSYGPGIPKPNVLVAKLAAAGGLQWAQALGGQDDDRAFSIVQTHDSGYAIAGYTFTYGPPPYPNVLVLKLNAAGLPQWARAYWCNPHLGLEEGYSIVQTTDGGFAVAGRAEVLFGGNFDAFVMKLDPIGNVMWMNYVGGIAEDEAYSVVEDVQRNVMAAGWTRSYGTAPGVAADIFVLQCSPSGVPIWQRTYGWAAGDEQVLGDRSLVATPDAGAAVCGPTTSAGPGRPSPNFLLMKLTPVGSVQWAYSHPSQNYPGLQSDVPYPLVQDAAGGYAAAGWTNSFDFLGREDFHFATFSQNGSREICTDSQVPVVDSFTIDGGRMDDETLEVELDSLSLEPESVSYHAICDTVVGVREPCPIRSIGRRTALLAAGGRISLVLERAADVDVRMYASDGRRLAVLAQGRFGAGVHRFELPSSAPPGVYVVTGSAGGVPVAVKVLKL